MIYRESRSNKGAYWLEGWYEPVEPNPLAEIERLKMENEQAYELRIVEIRRADKIEAENERFRGLLRQIAAHPERLLMSPRTELANELHVALDGVCQHDGGMMAEVVEDMKNPFVTIKSGLWRLKYVSAPNHTKSAWCRLCGAPASEVDQ